MKDNKTNNNFTAKSIAYIAIMAALLVGGQYVFSFVSGIEIVTVLLICFAYVFGIQCGVLCAVAFSLIRCFLFGFVPSVIVLYLIYYPLLALVFGLLGKVNTKIYAKFPLPLLVVVNLLLMAIMACGLYFLITNNIALHAYYVLIIRICLYILVIVCGIALLTFNTIYILQKCGILHSAWHLQLIFLTTIAAVCTICFTLLDDVISPLFVGMDLSAAIAYFYTSLLAMLPQTVCTIVTVGTLFYPLTAVFYKVHKL